MDAAFYQTFNEVEEKHWWFVARRAYIQACLSRFMPMDGSLRLAEIGAGTGGNLAMLSRFGALDAVEMDPHALGLAQQKAGEAGHRVCVHHGWLPDRISLNKQYDCVLALDVIEHVEDDAAAVSTLLDLVRPSGFLLITVPAYQWLWSAHDEANHHYRRYTARGLGQLFTQAAVRIHKLGYFNTLLFPIAVVRRLFQRWQGDAGDPHADLQLPGRLTNRTLCAVFSIERHWAGMLTMPFGLSVIILVQKA